MADHDNVPYIVIERRSGGATPFLWGLLLGAGAALLFAPRSGEETQEEIRRRAQRLRSAAEDRVNSVRGTVTDRIDRTRSQFQERIDTVREKVDFRTHQAREAVETGRRAAADAGTELRRRVEHAREGIQGGGAGERAHRMPGENRPPNASAGSASSPPASPQSAPPSPATPRTPSNGGTSGTRVDVEEAEGRPGLG